MQHSSVGSLLRTTQAFCQELCTRESGQYGIAFISERFPLLPEANQFREVLIEDPRQIPDAFAEAGQFFDRHGRYCYRWASAGGAATPELAAFLAAHGFHPREYRAMRCTQWVEQERDPSVRIIAARAMRAALREILIVRNGMAPRAGALYAEAFDERMDDPNLDMFVAMVGRPIACAALYQVGDIARILGLHSIPSVAAASAETALVAHALTMARRLSMRTIIAQVDKDDAPRRALFEAAGFEEDGAIVEFERNAGPRP